MFEYVSLYVPHAEFINGSYSNVIFGRRLYKNRAYVKSRGIGQKLMQVAENRAKIEGFRLLHLEVFANNNNAQTFYEKQGFKPEALAMIKPIQD